MLVNKVYKFRIYPNKEQEILKQVVDVLQVNTS
ncbi:helix-turn-helix domain-containing protein [Bacillus cytotoxicus]|nr:helix-turn-helix domain-containing protein [Bacillus cytotoxicus]MDH2880573.1 helix-turn-helix domain-containing protein [Bacillus cytotoxicus]